MPTGLKRYYGRIAMHSVFSDIRYSLRGLSKAPGYTLVIILILSASIGANTAIFSLLEAALFRPLPVRDGQHLIVLKWTSYNRPRYAGYHSFGGCATNAEKGRRAGCSFSYKMFNEFRSQSNTFSSLAAFSAPVQLTLVTRGPAHVAVGELVSGEFFQTVRARAIPRTHATKPRNISATLLPLRRSHSFIYPPG